MSLPAAVKAALRYLAACAVVLSSSGLSAQTILLQPGAGSQNEKRPTPRDPAYVAPLLPQGVSDSLGDADDSSLFLAASGSGDGDLLSLFAARRRKQAEAARRADRYGERNAQYLDESGQDRAFVEQSLLRQFGMRGLPRDFGEIERPETPARRFSVVFFLSLPFTALLASGLYQAFGPGLHVNGPADYPALAGVLGAGALLSSLVAYYDYSQMQALRAHTAAHVARTAHELSNHPFGPRGRKGAPGAPVTPDEDAEREARERLRARPPARLPGDDSSYFEQNRILSVGWQWRF
jgi:hypothetical protein